MRTKAFLAALAFMLMASTIAYAQRGLVKHNMQIRDERNRIVTDITSITICTSGTTSAATIYQDEVLATAITQPITTVSANTTLTQGTGSCYWYGPDGYDVTLISTTYGTLHLKGYTASDETIVFPTYWEAQQSQVSLDAQSFTLGTDADWVINGGSTANLLKFTPASDGSTFRVGLADGSKSSNLQWYTDNALGFFIDESGNTVDILGLALNVNVSNNTAANICTGTSTGTVTIGGTGTQSIAIGNGAGAKTVALGSVTGASSTAIGGGTGDVTITSGDDIFLVTNTGTGDVISLINTAGTAAGSLILRSTAGGVDMDAAAALDIDIAGGQVLIASKDNAASAIALTANVGASETIVVTNTKGTGEGAITLTSTVGGIDLNAATGKNVDILGGQFIVLSNEDVANAIYLRTNTGTAETINVTNSMGSDEAAISLASTAGGIKAAAALLKDIDIDGGQVLITGADAVANQVYIQATGTVAGNAVNVATTNGGIVLTAGNAANGDITLTAGDDLNLTVTGDVKVTNTGAMNIGDGGTTNYSSFAGATGLLTFVGSACPTKMRYFPMQQFTALAGSPVLTTEIGTNQGMAMAFDAAAEEGVSTTILVPEDWKAGSDVTLNIYWCSSDATGATHDVVWDVNTIPLASDELTTTAVIVDTITDALVSATAYDLNVSQNITIAASTEWAAGDMVTLILFRDGDNAADDATGDALVFGIKLSYTSDKP